jgi:purine nucleoside phosphorylase
MKSTDKIVKIINKNFGVTNIDVAIVVGSGQADSVPNLKNPIVIPYDKLGLPKSRVSGHSGKFVVGEYNGKIV